MEDKPVAIPPRLPSFATLDESGWCVEAANVPGRRRARQGHTRQLETADGATFKGTKHSQDKITPETQKQIDFGWMLKRKKCYTLDSSPSPMEKEKTRETMVTANVFFKR